MTVKQLRTKVLAFAVALPLSLACLAGCSSGKAVSEKVSLDAFEDVEIDLSMANIEIKTGDEYELSINCGKDYPAIEHSVNDKKLTIKEQSGFVFISYDLDASVELTVPKSAELNNVNVVTDTGGITLSANASGDVSLTSDTGNLNVSVGTPNSLRLESDTGNILVSDTTPDRMNVESDTGNVDVRGYKDLASATIRLSTDTGNVTVDGSSVGKTFMQTGGKHSLEIESDTGNIGLS